ncbi:MAG: DNA polymerase III subunit chi [Rubrivivax sp.]|nr:DNA polymerase III subunit chi [Rubrivivax sp.]
MNEVEFHTGVADRVGFACRLLRKACRQGVRVLVTASPETLAELDRALWTFEERDFLPHVRMPGAAAAVAARTPVWLAPRAGLEGAPRVLLNLGAEPPASLDVADRLIEVVTADPDDAEAGRARWRAYKAAGLEIRHHASSRA